MLLSLFVLALRFPGVEETRLSGVAAVFALHVRKDCSTLSGYFFATRASSAPSMEGGCSGAGLTNCLSPEKNTSGVHPVTCGASSALAFVPSSTSRAEVRA